MTNKFDAPSGAPPGYTPHDTASSIGSPYPPQPAHLHNPAQSPYSQYGSPYPQQAYPQQQQYPFPQQGYPQQHQGGGYPPQGGYYAQPPMGYQQQGPMYQQQGPYGRPQGQYIDQRRGGGPGFFEACLAGLACCCCLDLLF